MVKSPQTRADRVFHGLKRDILACRLMPSQKLKINEVCTRFDVSIGAAREALSRLVSDGIIRMEPQKGFSVAPISRKELEDLTEARILLELKCIRLSIEHGDLEWETGVVSSHHRLGRVPQSLPGGELNPAWSDAHETFHSALVAACPNDRLRMIRESLYQHSERYRHWSVSLPTSHAAIRDVAGEHDTIVKLVVARDSDAACRAIQNHLQRTTTDFLNVADAMNREIA